jgi:hypothetical protein
MKRTLFEVILVIALGAAGYFAWTYYKASGNVGGQVKDLTEQKTELQGKLEVLEKQMAEQAEAFKALGPKAQQFDAARSALSGGQVLEDLEKLYAGNKKGLSSEQQLGLGVVRLLSKGPNDQGALDALNKTLERHTKRAGRSWQRRERAGGVLENRVPQTRSGCACGRRFCTGCSGLRGCTCGPHRQSQRQQKALMHGSSGLLGLHRPE